MERALTPGDGGSSSEGEETVGQQGGERGSTFRLMAVLVPARQAQNPGSCRLVEGGLVNGPLPVSAPAQGGEKGKGQGSVQYVRPLLVSIHTHSVAPGSLGTTRKLRHQPRISTMFVLIAPMAFTSAVFVLIAPMAFTFNPYIDAQQSVTQWHLQDRRLAVEAGPSVGLEKPPQGQGTVQ